jgi:acyl carrier protein
MNDGFKISGGETQVVEKIVEVPAQNGIQVQSNNEEEIMNKEIYQLLQATLDSFKINQTKSLEIFERYMEAQNQQSQQLLNVLTEHMSIGNESTVQAPLISNQLSTEARDTSFLKNGTNGNHTKPHSNGSNGHVDIAVAPPATPASKGAGIDLSKLTSMLLAVVSEKTGYPAEMLELNMDMEADLGIDSIKRVEIFGALTKQYPAISGIDPNELTELRTLTEIVNYVGEKGGASNDPVAQTAPQTTTKIADPVVPVSNNTSSNGSVDVNILTASLLEVVSEKTGYPAEMLELNMDMEADLGIDSIKRVEIFGALTKLHPEMSGIDPNELTELRTLQEIVNFVTNNSTGDTTSTDQAASSPPTSIAVTPTPPQAVSSNGTGTNNELLQNALLQVVSEKTGYPAEMLELNMDMEADLGIDSIKRVEIFGALTKQYPELSDINPNELTELRTLAEIVSYVSANGKKKMTT